MLKVAGLLSPIWKVLKSILLFTIPVPIFAILIIGGWLYVDQHAVKALKDELKQYVAGADLAAAAATAKKLQYDLDVANMLKDAAEKRAMDAQAADAADALDTSKRIAADKCSTGKCAVWTKEDIKWFAEHH